MKKNLFFAFTLLLFHSSTLAHAATPKPTPLPTSPYTCIQDKLTCTTETSCYKVAPGGRTCPRGEVCCAEVTQKYPPDKTPTPTPKITPFKAQGTDRWTRCTSDDEVNGREYHPLRPFPASPCGAHLIPIKDPEAPFNRAFPDLWQVFSCGKSANPFGTVTAPGVVVINDVRQRYPYSGGTSLLYFDNIDQKTNTVNCPSGPSVNPQDPAVIACDHFKQAYENLDHRSKPILCDGSSGDLCFLAKVIFKVTLDYSDAIFPILGNTTNRTLSDRQKVNNYLSWYLNGTILGSEELPLDTSKETDNDRIINFSGPSNKLLPESLMEIYREALRWAIETNDVHNYMEQGNRLTDENYSSPFFDLTTREDVMSETQPALILKDQPVTPEIDGKIVQIGLKINDADSRIYFPHLKNNLALSQILSMTYKPVQGAPNLNPQDQQEQLRKLVTQRFSLLQGFALKVWDPVTQKYVNFFRDNIGGDGTKVEFAWWDDLVQKFSGRDGQRNFRTVSRNTEVMQFDKAPEPLFTNYNQRFPSITSQKCDITPAIGGQGDSLIGGKINTTLTIWQAFKYKPSGIIVKYNGIAGNTCSDINLGYNTNPPCRTLGLDCTSLDHDSCTSGNTSTTADDSCCFGSCEIKSECESAGFTCVRSVTNCPYIVNKSCQPSGGNCCTDSPFSTPIKRPPRCQAWPDQQLKTSGRIAIFVKVPFVNKLYDVLVKSPDSLMRRFLPLNAGKPSPTPGTNSQANYTCAVIDNPSCVNASCSQHRSADTCSDTTQGFNCCKWVFKPKDFLKSDREAIVGQGSANYTASANDKDGVKVNDVTVVAGSGGAPVLYYPKIGSLFEYLLGAGKDPLNLQCLLRPQGYCGSKTTKCGELPELPKAAGSCQLGKISSRIGNIPDSLKQIVEAAAQSFKTPPNLILAQMYGEGLFNKPPYQRFEWTDENVKNWATCEPLPGCQPEGTDYFIGFNGTTFQNIANTQAYTNVMKTVVPERTTFSQCNLLDSIFAAAYSLHNSAHGSPFFKNPNTGRGYSCLGIELNTGSGTPTSCDWNDSQYESAIRIYEFGTGWGLTPLGFYTCATKDNSCFSGGGPAAQCPTDLASKPDTCAISGNNSHNLCVWEVAHGD